jgi:hypothetical protein
VRNNGTVPYLYISQPNLEFLVSFQLFVVRVVFALFKLLVLVALVILFAGTASHGERLSKRYQSPRHSARLKTRTAPLGLPNPASTQARCDFLCHNSLFRARRE